MNSRKADSLLSFMTPAGLEIDRRCLFLLHNQNIINYIIKKRLTHFACLAAAYLADTYKAAFQPGSGDNTAADIIL